MKRSMIFIFIAVLLTANVFSQGLAGETELWTDGNGIESWSHYFFYSRGNFNAFVRYFWIEQTFKRWEFAAGPSFSFGSTRLDLQVGWTTNKEVVTVGVFVTKLFNREIVHVFDGKIATTSDPSELFQKTFVSLNGDGSWHARIEHVIVADDFVSVRVGPEYRHRNSSHVEPFINPFFDTVINRVGLQGGFRF